MCVCARSRQNDGGEINCLEYIGIGITAENNDFIMSRHIMSRHAMA